MDIDLVYTWVNAADVAFHEHRATFARQEVRKDFSYRAGAARFEDNGELRFSLRSVERNLPFIRRVYVVHAGAAPSWLDPSRDDLVFVPQDDIVPPAYSPTFQSDVVEAFIHRIPGLSEHYVYSNDDFFFARPHGPGDFFDATGRALVGMDWRLAGTQRRIVRTYRAMEMNAARAIGRHLDLAGVHAVTRPTLKAWLWLLLHRAALLNTVTHVAQPFRKSIWGGFHKTFATEVGELGRQRFRSGKGLTVNLMAHHYAIANDLAVFSRIPYQSLHRGASIEDANRFREDVVHNRQPWTRFCLNDQPAVDPFDWRDFVSRFLNEYLPDRSRWETD